jgi:hypothetical protein
VQSDGRVRYAAIAIGCLIAVILCACGPQRAASSGPNVSALIPAISPRSAPAPRPSSTPTLADEGGLCPEYLLNAHEFAAHRLTDYQRSYIMRAAGKVRTRDRSRLRWALLQGKVALFLLSQPPSSISVVVSWEPILAFDRSYSDADAQHAYYTVYPGEPRAWCFAYPGPPNNHSP